MEHVDERRHSGRGIGQLHGRCGHAVDGIMPGRQDDIETERLALHVEKGNVRIVMLGEEVRNPDIEDMADSGFVAVLRADINFGDLGRNDLWKGKSEGRQ